ncbi:IS3 family transposase [Pontibacter amylolyticus]|uniref:Integrase n=1 Tax=Pontibacter amylolyticus TaxID=1424080 RepID=A0ABQ1WKY6_9BACT|nr:IS3 family transposase [Pontibacter amylolyticus]GGG32180.1 integrase [Pontibacter amylolyticus]
MFAPLAASFPAKGAGRTTRKQVAQSLGYSRQYLYKLQRQEATRQLVEQQVKALVCEQRKLLPRLGTRKLHFKLGPQLQAKGIKLGRDKLFCLMREFDLLIGPKRRYVQTTMSRHHLRKYPNLVKGLPLTAPEQVWASDITYVRTRQGTCYVNLVTDAFSRRIMGYTAAADMEAVSMGRALVMALSAKQTTADTIHHSDRGLQYCSRHYVGLATERGLRMSMTQDSDPYENALAERMNRTLKEEFGLGNTLDSLKQVELLLKQAVELYNAHRPHLALKMKTPQQVHQEKIPACLNKPGPC